MLYCALVNPTWVGIDQGSTATKACLLDHRGRVRRVVSRRIATRASAPGRIEHDPEAIYRSVRAALAEILGGRSAPAAVGIACQRSTCLFWDAHDGKPLTPAISWQDLRADAICRRLSRRAPTVSRRTGLRLSPHYAAGKIRWLFERHPGLRRRAASGSARFGTLDAYLLFRLTDGVSWSTDPTHAARTLLMSLETLEWDPYLLDLFGIPRRCLPPIRPSAFPAGIARIGGARIRIAATLGDQQAALLGVGCTRRGEMVINYGTGAFAALHTGRRAVRAEGLLTSVAWSSDRGARFLLEGPVNSAGSAVDWIDDLVHATSSDAALDEPERLPVFVPALGGLGAPHWRSDVRGAMFDLGRDTEADQLAAAALAGVACRIREVVERMRESRQPVRRIVAAGGLTRRKGLLPFQARLLGAALFHARAADATARGAALLAGHAAGAWDLEGPRAPRSAVRRISAPERSRSLENYYLRFVSCRRKLMAPAP